MKRLNSLLRDFTRKMTVLGLRGFLVSSMVTIGLASCSHDPFDSPGLYRLIDNSVIQSRGPSSMFVADNPTDPSCPKSAYFSFAPNIRVFNSDAAATDTSALIVGRHVSVWTSGSIDPSCPAYAQAQQVVLR